MARDLQWVVGLGATGLSCARYLKKQGMRFAVMDSRPKPPNLLEFLELFPDVMLSVGGLKDDLLDRAERIILSPGISLKEPAIARQIAKNIPVIGDIELFAQATKVPVIGITGTNAKSTVTTLVGEMAAAAGKRVHVGGNLGTPALDLLTTPEPELYVLELSSYQLETTHSLKPAVATVLNITPDHMDRYGTLEAYTQAKLHVYSHCDVAVCNRDDSLTECKDPKVKRILHFTLNEPGAQEFGLLKKGNETYLAFEDKALMRVKDLPVLGRHYQANALAALAIGYGYGLPFEPMIDVLVKFKGLPHRCQLIREMNGVYWYNDSKGTNVGATLAAIEGLGSVIDGKLVLIAGGVGKNADFSPLVPAISKYVKTVVLIGEAAPILADVLNGHVNLRFGKSMDEAVVIAKEESNSGDSVLLSPACASFDMFKSFEHRGDVFTDLVNELA